MENGRFTREEREYLLSLDAVDEVRASSIVYSKAFKEEFMRRYLAGEGPGAIFASAGMPSSLVGYKRIERAAYHWREAAAKGALTATDAPGARHRAHVDRLRREKREAVARQREIRERRVAEAEGKLARQRERARERERKIIASQAAEIARLKAQVRALKANGALASGTRRAPEQTTKAERFETIFRLRSEDPTFNVSAACEALEVSRRGYYDWVAAAPARAAREEADLADAELVRAAYAHRGFRKGSRQVVDRIRRDEGVTMNRKKVLRLTRKYGLAPERPRRRPRRPGADGGARVAPNVVARDFRRGEPLAVMSTDITYLGGRDGFSYLSGVIDCETDVVLAHTTSTSLAEPLVIDTLRQLEGLPFPEGALANSDQGVHYTASAYREALGGLGVGQSMSRRGNCWDNAPIESFWGRLKEEVGPTAGMSHGEIAAVVDDYVDYYNNDRGQARLGWLTPAEYAASLGVSRPSAIGEVAASL